MTHYKPASKSPDRKPKPVEQTTRGFNAIFLHSDLDEAGLELAEFRVLAHLSRRASGGMAWPGIESIAEVCRCNHKTARAAIRTLEARKMVVTETRPGRTNVYRLTAPCEWVMEPLPKEAGFYPSRIERATPPVLSGPPLPKEAGEGYPLKEIHEGEEIAAVPPLLPPDPEQVRKVRHTVFVKLWCEGWEETYGERYQFTPQDGATLKRFLSTATLDAEEIFKVARLAWGAKNDPKMFNCSKHTGSIMSFLKWFNEMKAELKKRGDLTNSAPGQSKWADIARA